MKKYRVCLFRFGKAQPEESEIECSDDGAALIRSHVMLAGFEVAEVWDAGRLVSRVMRAGSPQAGIGARTH